VAPVAHEAFDSAGDALARPHGNCYWVVPDRLLAGEYPHAHLAALQAAGLTDFIDLTAETEGLPPYRERLQTDRRWQRFGITDYGVPSPDRMRTILSAIQRVLSEPERRLYLHCHGGAGRTGTVVGCLLVESGLAPQEALALLARKWQAVAKRDRVPESPETDEQRAFVAGWRRIGGRGADL